MSHKPLDEYARELPEGFEPRKIYPDGVRAVAVVGYAVEKTSQLIFEIGKRGLPKLPLRASNRINHVGWDIPTCWAVDAEGRCFADNAHGHALVEVQPLQLLSFAYTENDLVAETQIRQVLALKPRLPDWVIQARAAGWTPPKDWDERQWE
jgi:hypothetical protein